MPLPTPETAHATGPVVEVGDPKLPDLTSNNLTGMVLLDAATALAVGAGGIIVKSADAGATRTKPALTASATTALNDLAMANSSTAWAVGASRSIYRTTDGGAAWTQQTPADSVTETLNGVAVWDQNNA